MVDPSKHVPLRVSGFYLLFGVVWILTSDVLMAWSEIVDVRASLVSSCKGLFFVGVSAAIIYLLMRQQLERLSCANSLAHAVINGTTDAVFVKDRNGRYLMFNRAAAAQVNKRAEDVIGRDDHFVFDAQSAAELKDRDRRIMESGEADTAEEVLTIENSTTVFLATKVPYRDQFGNVIGLIGISRDITQQKEAEKQLRIQRDRLASIVEAVPVIICSFQSWPDGSFSMPFCSSLIESIYDLSKEELRHDASSIFKRIHPDDVQDVLDSIEASTRTMTLWEREYRVCRPGREEIWVEGRSVPTRQEDGSILWQGYVADITTRKRDQERLRSIQQRLDHAQLIAKMGSWTWEPVSNRVWWSDAIYNLFGFDPNTTVPSFQNILDRLDPADRKIAIDRVDALMQCGDGFSNEFLANRTDGSKIWILSAARAARDENGRLIQVDGFDQDITIQKQIEDELRLSEERLRLALRSAGGGVWDWDLRTDQAWWSPEMYSLWGIDPNEPMALANSLESIVDQDRDYVRNTSKLAIDNKSDYHAEFRIDHPERGECWISSSGRTISDQDGAIRLIGISQDITDRRRLEDHLRQSQKMEAVGRLAGGVAHDFNNLLTVINGYCRILVDQITEPPDVRDSLYAIRDAADRATRLTRQLLSFSRKAMVELQVLDLNQVVMQSAALLRKLVGQEISVELALAPTACFIEADPIQIDQVILNLTVNARDASQKGDIVTIATRSVNFDSPHSTTTGTLSPGKYIELTVTDQGIGILESLQTQIFEPFFSTKEREKGTGLGLSVAHGIIAQSGGQIDVQSAPGKGASFRIYLKEASPQTATAASSSRAIEGGKEFILLVEDEQAIRALCERTLRAHGYQVFAASGGSEAIEWFSKSPEKIDMLVTDLMMPNMSGRELADALRSKKPELLILYISGYSDDLFIQEVIRSGRDTLLQKPFLPGELASKVREVFDGADHELAPQDDISEQDVSDQ
ncbi:PAS domain-containing protein [Neorhodopirellula pilleata]|nr:PAS domain-containing protein [Neorhodopirellula pilleata]